MRRVALLLFPIITSCGVSPLQSISKDGDACLFGVGRIPTCEHASTSLQVKASPVLAPLADDQVLLQAVEASLNGQEQRLEIAPDTVFFAGDIGHIAFDDINFDGFPDLAITTSAGAKHVFLDYWLYSQNAKRFVRLGNLPELSADPATQTLSLQVQVSETQYERKRLKWNGSNLIPID
ncbi:hypothetical protein O5O45_18460 [Hahella aquimaris]|uniref:XAC2610-related protein n=1 Tax=Hahella sp. HNIBRBA332 TaxID=3015983 RepID=UPI00273C438A|nr:hypothetical protein [Hahella sp. HNIBRBA332]WLQ11713.1 hypothetical protein O5O45_18460 [Hahella sp. HNIBRBA332]